MFTVEMTSMPASSSSSTSCQRFSFRLPGMFEWASSSTRATRGDGAPGCVDVSTSSACVPVGDATSGGGLEVPDLFDGARSSVGLNEPDDHVGAAFVRALTFVEHREGLADAGRGAEVGKFYRFRGAGLT